MTQLQTGIAIALALVVVGGFFIFPGLLPFGSAPAPAAADQSLTTDFDTSMPIEDTGELQVTDITVGTGATAAPGDTITVNYIGSLLDGKVFDASANHGDTGFSFVLGAGMVIKGWDQGLVGMQEGGTRRLVIPAALAYGNQEVGGVIPANSTLVFEVELLKVEKGTP
jgi:FKBP-type peptidyl-prolyl cis-trans isomerase